MYPAPPQQRGSVFPGRPGAPRKDTDARTERRDSSSVTEFMRVLQELLKTIRAFITAHKIISGLGITIVIVAVVGNIPNNPPTTRYPAALQQEWLGDCESLSFNTAPECGCELSYFENHVSAQQFEEDYSAIPPGVVPPELAGAEECSSL